MGTLKRLKGRVARRPSAGLVVGVVAIVLALGGTALAGTKIHFGDLAKDTKQKVLPYGSATAIPANLPCDPKDANYVVCAQAPLSVSKAYARRALVVFDGTFNTGQPGAKGTCRLQVDNQPLGTTLMHLGAGQDNHVGDHGSGFGMNTIVQPLTGSHIYQLACNETDGDIKIPDGEMTVITLRG